MSGCFFIFSVFWLSSPLSTSHAPSQCVCLWAWQQQQKQQSTPESDQLITQLLYLPGLSTTSLLNYQVPYGDLWVPHFFVFYILWVFCVFCICAHALVFVGSYRNLQRHSALFPACLLSWVPPASSSQACLPTCNPGHLIHVTLESTICRINHLLTTSFRRSLHLGPRNINSP